MDIIKVSGNSRTSAVAGAIAGVFREHHHAEVQAIGAGAVNQAVKALVLATGYLAEDGLDVVFTPEFVDVEIDGKTRTAIRLVVDLRDPGGVGRKAAEEDDFDEEDPAAESMNEPGFGEAPYEEQTYGGEQVSERPLAEHEYAEPERFREEEDDFS